jgi:predicted secreted Zn-dependent protease
VKILVVVLLAALPLPCGALEKCVGPDGKVSYSDRPCPGGEKRTSVGADASLTGAQMEYYDVSAPGGHTARADWYLSYTYRTHTASSGCAVESVSTKLDLKVRMPRWTPPSNASAELVRRWDRYLDALRVHEAGHLQTGRDFESNFRRSASGMSAGDCGALGSAVRARFDSLLEQARQRDRDYDAQTRHGATQGAYYQ